MEIKMTEKQFANKKKSEETKSTKEKQIYSY